MKQIVVTILLFSSLSLLSQQRYTPEGVPIPWGPQPEVGKLMPSFSLNYITQYKSKTASLNDFKGKWLFLDFWFTGCRSCIKSFPKVNEYYKAYKDKLTWMMVGLNDQKYNKGIEKLYENFRQKQNLEMPAAFDSVLADKWGIGSMPHIIIVDPSGIVRYITGGRDMSAEKINDLLAGKKISLYPKDIDRPEFDAKAYETKDDTVSDNLLYSSILTKWNGERQYGGVEIDRWVNWPRRELIKGYNFAMVPLFFLYDHAYIGQSSFQPGDSMYNKYWRHPVLEIKDSSCFRYDFTNEVGKGTYNYNLKIPVSQVSKEYIMQTMQSELKNIFGYDASLETRKIPAWKLIAKPGTTDKLKSKEGVKYATPPHLISAGFTLKNYPATDLILFIQSFIDNDEIAFFDETGLKGNIDIVVDADMTNIEEIRKALQKNGLDLVKGEKEMKVIVIREPKN